MSAAQGKEIVLTENAPEPIGESSTPTFCVIDNWAQDGPGNSGQDPAFVDADSQPRLRARCSVRRSRLLRRVRCLSFRMHHRLQDQRERHHRLDQEPSAEAGVGEPGGERQPEQEEDRGGQPGELSGEGEGGGVHGQGRP